MSVRVRFPSEAQGRSRTESLMVSRPAFILHPIIHPQGNRLNVMAVAVMDVAAEIIKKPRYTERTARQKISYYEKN